MADPQSTRLAEHEAGSWSVRCCRNRAISAFIGVQKGEPGWCISIAEVRDFIERSPLYPPLLAAMKELQDG